jgi:outer membrane protein TolC
LKKASTSSPITTSALSLARMLVAVIGALFLSVPASAQQATATASATVTTVPTIPPTALSIDEAVASALAKDPGVISANLDWLSASAKADSAKWKQIPSLSASAGYTRLSELPASDSSMNINFQGQPYSFTLPSLLNEFSFGLNMQYPVFDGFRVKESIAIAHLQAQAKEVSTEVVKRSLIFDVRKAYWEAVRATYNLSTLEQNLELMRLNSELTSQQLGQGVATKADQLAAQMRLEQANEDLGDARAIQKRAFLTLASLMGADVSSMGISMASDDAPLPFVLSTKPDESALPQAAALDEAALVSEALAKRPETRATELARMLAEHSIELSRATLYPTVALTGNFAYADPNQRVPFQTDPTLFTGTWALGLQLDYDIGGIPAALDDIKAQTFAASKAKADEERQRNAVVMDVESCIVDLERARRDLASTEAMVAQAEENLRVVQGRMAAGSAKDIDLRSSQFDLLRMEFAVTNKRIDILIAEADLARAVASEELK